MRQNRKLLFRLIAAAALIALAALMFIIGRGHTIYFDNKGGEYGGTAYEAPYKIDVIVGGEKVAKLYDGERGMTDAMGQSLKMRLEITGEKGGSKTAANVSLNLPYNMDGIVINIPAMMKGLPQDAYLSEFIAAPSADESDNEEVITDEFGAFSEDEE